MEVLIGFAIVLYLDSKEPIPIGRWEVGLILVVAVVLTFVIAFALILIGVSGIYVFYLVGLLCFFTVPLWRLVIGWRGRKSLP